MNEGQCKQPIGTQRAYIDVTVVPKDAGTVGIRVVSFSIVRVGAEARLIIHNLQHNNKEQYYISIGWCAIAATVCNDDG